MATRAPHYPEVYRPSQVAGRGTSRICLPVDLTGVPTIPADVHAVCEAIRNQPLKTLPRGYAKRTATAIRQACEEIRRRRALLMAREPAAEPEDTDADD